MLLKRRRLVVVERGKVDVGLAIGRAAVGLGDQAEALRSQQHDVEAPVVQFLDPDQFADAADLVERSASSPSSSGWIIAIRPAPAIASWTIAR